MLSLSSSFQRACTVFQTEDGKDAYALNSLVWSAFQDAEDRKRKYGIMCSSNVYFMCNITESSPLLVFFSQHVNGVGYSVFERYWFVGPLKHRFTYLMSTLGAGWPRNKRAELAVGEKCNGCSRCYTAPAAHAQKHWSSSFAPAKGNTNSAMTRR